MGFDNGKLVRVVLHAQVAALEWTTVLHYDLVDSPAGANDPQSLADAFRDDVIPTYKALFTPTITINPVLVEQEKDPQNPTSPRSSWTSGTDVVGTKTESTDELPLATTFLASLRTDTVGRRARGRIFIPGVWLEGEQSGGVWGSNAHTLAAAFTDSIPRQPDISPPLSDSTANWCVYSRTQRGADLDPYAPHITSVLLRNGVYWLRSRQNSF